MAPEQSPLVMGPAQEGCLVVSMQFGVEVPTNNGDVEEVLEGSVRGVGGLMTAESTKGIQSKRQERW